MYERGWGYMPPNEKRMSFVIMTDTVAVFYPADVIRHRQDECFAVGDDGSSK